MVCPACGFVLAANAPRCPNCGHQAGQSWPPPPSDRPPAEAIKDDGGVGQALYLGWRLLLLSLFCAPPVFLPLAGWQGWQANRRSGAGAGNVLLLLCAGIGAFWLGLLLFWLRFGSKM